jgi:alkylhydroperoxidase family enzyme
VDLPATATRPLAAFAVVMASARAAVDPGLYAQARARIASALDLGPPHAGDADPACLAFAEQFALDVSAITPEQRGALTAVLGAKAAPFVQALYAIDFELRLRAVLRELFGGDPLPAEPAAAPRELWPALEAMLPEIARLSSLDPFTTEIVRLRGARAHNCRMCQSLRNVRAVESGGDEATFDKIDRYEHSDLSDRHKVALRLADAILWTPARIPEGLADSVRAHFTREQQLELVLDVTRNALNKFAVAMGVDGIGVGEGIGYYDTDERGELVYGLTPRAERR